ncbi:MAG: hypothetical protein ACPGN3_14505 [Opitutales bacterium]
MPELNIRMDPAVRAFLRRMLQGIYESLQETGKARGYSPEAEDDLEIWVEGLESENLEVLEGLLSFVKKEDFGVGAIDLTLEELFAVMKACSCLRLHLRETALKDVTDEALENAEFDPGQFKSGLQEAYIVYSLLAYLQTLALEGAQGV